MNDEFDRGEDFFKSSNLDEEDGYIDREDEDIKMTTDMALERIAANPKSLKERIDKSLEILNNFKNREDKRLSRSDVIDTLRK